MISARGEPGWHWRQIPLRPDLENKIHSYDYVEQEVTVEEPETGIVCPKPQDDVTVVWNRDGILSGWQIELSVEQTLSVEIQSVFQVYLGYVAVLRSSDTDHVEGVSMEMERVTQVWLLDCNWKIGGCLWGSYET